jgi:hypothetical protein
MKLGSSCRWGFSAAKFREYRRKVMLETHPDRKGGSADKFSKEMAAASLPQQENNIPKEVVLVQLSSSEWMHGVQKTINIVASEPCPMDCTNLGVSRNHNLMHKFNITVIHANKCPSCCDLKYIIVTKQIAIKLAPRVQLNKPLWVVGNNFMMCSLKSNVEIPHIERR